MLPRKVKGDTVATLSGKNARPAYRLYERSDGGLSFPSLQARTRVTRQLAAAPADSYSQLRCCRINTAATATILYVLLVLLLPPCSAISPLRVWYPPPCLIQQICFITTTAI